MNDDLTDLELSHVHSDLRKEDRNNHLLLKNANGELMHGASVKRLLRMCWEVERRRGEEGEAAK